MVKILVWMLKVSFTCLLTAVLGEGIESQMDVSHFLGYIALQLF